MFTNDIVSFEQLGPGVPEAGTSLNDWNTTDGRNHKLIKLL